MSVQELPSGRWRARVWVPALGREVAVRKILPDEPQSYSSRRQAERAKGRAHEALLKDERRGRRGPTVAEWWDTWTTDPLFLSKKKTSTNTHNAERTRGFVREHADRLVCDIGDLDVARWLKGGKNISTVPALRKMFNDAAGPLAGRLIERNPFAALGLESSRGNADAIVPTEAEIAALIGIARRVAPPSFAAWLQFAAYTGMRPSEIDAVDQDAIDLERSRVIVTRQWSPKAKTFTTPKNGKHREAPLPVPAREAALSQPDGQDFLFVNGRGTHWRASTRAYHWNAVRAAAGEKRSLYLMTRHFAGSYMVNELELDSEDVAISLGHTDGGDLVRRLYGHREAERALQRVQGAYDRTARVVPLSLVREAEGA